MLETNAQKDTAVVVAGAGPTGLTLASNLAAAGVPVRVLDRASGPATTSRALGLQPRGIEVLDRAGALGDLEARSNPIRQVVIDLGHGRTARLRLGQATRLVTRPGLLVSQADIEAELRLRLHGLGVEVEWGREVTDGVQDENGVKVTLADGAGLESGWLVGCDGAHSRVRKIAGVGFPGVRVIERFLLADVHADLSAPRDAAAVWLRPDGLVAAFPLPGDDLWRLMAPAPAGLATELAPRAVVDALTTQLKGATGVAPVVSGIEWTSTFAIHRRLADRYRAGRILLAGDAAHIHSPVGGQGMNTGLGDADNLAWKLALVVRGAASPTLLDTYDAERRPIAADVLESTTAMTRMGVGDGVLPRLVRSHLIAPALAQPWVQRLVWERASQLRINYRNGPLGAAARWPLTKQLRPGDRVPDVPCAREDGRATRLHAELGARWALLAPTRWSSYGEADIAACAERVHARLGAEAVAVLASDADPVRDVLLVRPDGHLAWRGEPLPGVVDAWLAAVLGTGRAPRARRNSNA